MSDNEPDLRALLEAATPGPWEARIESGYPWVALYDDQDKIPEGESLPSFELGGSAKPADAALIAALRNEAAALLDDRDRLRALEAGVEALADTFQREAAPYLYDGNRYEASSNTLRARADCRAQDGDRLRALLATRPVDAGVTEVGS